MPVEELSYRAMKTKLIQHNCGADITAQVMGGHVLHVHDGDFQLSPDGIGEAVRRGACKFLENPPAPAQSSVQAPRTRTQAQQREFDSRVLDILERDQRYPRTTVQDAPQRDPAMTQEELAEAVATELERRSGAAPHQQSASDLGDAIMQLDLQERAAFANHDEADRIVEISPGHYVVRS